MRNYFFLFLWVCLYFDASGQTNNVRQYWGHINQAEEYVCKEKYSAALMCYDSAFSSMGIEIASNFYNASICAVYAYDFKKVKYYCDSLVVLGCEMPFFMKKKSYKPFRYSTYWPQFIEDYEKSRNRYIKHVNWPLRVKIESLYAKDRELRLIRDDDDSTYTVSPAAIRLRDDSVTAALTAILAQYGFPPDHDLGVFVEDDTILVFSPLDLMLRHAYLNKHFEMTPILTKGLYEGRMHPERFMWWYDLALNAKKSFIFGTLEPYMSINNNVYLNKPSEDQVKDIDKNRDSLMLCSYEEFCDKINYQLFRKGRQRDFLIAIWGGVAIVDGLGAEEEKIITRKMIKTDLKYGTHNK